MATQSYGEKLIADFNEWLTDNMVHCGGNNYNLCCIPERFCVRDDGKHEDLHYLRYQLIYLLLTKHHLVSADNYVGYCYECIWSTKEHSHWDDFPHTITLEHVTADRVQDILRNTSNPLIARACRLIEKYGIHYEEPTYRYHG